MRIYGNITHRLGKCNVATSYLTQFLELLPEDRMTRFALADCLNQTGRADTALNTLVPLLGTGETDVDAHILATTIAPNLTDTAATMAILSNALKAIPEGEDNAELTHKIRQQLAVTLAVTGDAKSAAQQLLASDSNSKHVLDNLVVLANLKVGQGDLTGAVNVAEQIIKIWPKAPEGPNLMGTIQYRRKDIEKALEYYDQALLIDTHYESARKNRALALVEAGRFSDAEQDLLLLVEKAPNDGEIRGMLGRTWLNSNQPEKALTELAQAEQLLPNSAIIASDHALALAYTGYISSAIQKAQSAKTLAQNDANLIAYLDKLIVDLEQHQAENASLKQAADEASRQEYLKQKAEREKREAKES